MSEKTLLVYRRVDRERSPVAYVLSLVASGYLRATRPEAICEMGWA